MNIEKYIDALPDKNSSDQYWINWHRDMKRNFGKNDANQAFIVAFAYKASSAAKTRDLFQYGRTQGLDLETNLLGDAGRIVAGVKENLNSITGRIGKVFKTGRLIITVLVVLTLIPVFMLLFKIAQNPERAIGAASIGFGKSKGLG